MTQEKQTSTKDQIPSTFPAAKTYVVSIPHSKTGYLTPYVSSYPPQAFPLFPLSTN